MDLHAPAPSSASVSSDGIYGLAENPDASPAPAESPAPAPAPVEAPAPAAEPAQAVEKTNGKATAKDKAAEAEAEAKPKKKKKKRSQRVNAPAWAVSLMVHVGFLVTLGMVTLGSTDAGKKLMANINSALVSAPKGDEANATPIYADPGTTRSAEAVGSETAEQGGAGGESGGTGTGGFGGIGTGPPSATPRIGKVGRVSEGGGGGAGVGSLKIAANVSGLSMMPAAPGMDLGGGGGIVGDVTYEATDVGQSLDQIAREILRHLTQHKLTVLWLFDESESMKDDQKAVNQKFDRITSELKSHAEAQDKKKVVEPLTHVVASFGGDLHYIQEKPTADISVIAKAIDKIPVDESGVENTLHALGIIIDKYSNLIKKDRKLLVVLVTDESGDDGGYVEEAHQAVVSRGVPIYIIGRQALFGAENAHLQYVDPVTKDVYWPTIRRGPETADVELMQWDGLHDRWDEQPSGLPPYELARITKDSGGIYFLLPSEENMRVRQREKAYRIADLKEYAPDYKSRIAYVSERQKSEFRRTLYDVILATKWRTSNDGSFYYPRHFKINPAEMVPAAQQAIGLSTERLNLLLAIQAKLEKIQKLRDREPEKRWQAHYDLMLAQVVAYQVKSYEYRACMEDMIKNPPKPKKMPTSDLVVEWVIDHSGERIAPKERTDKKIAEATKLLKEVIDRHPRTPWADLAQDELNRGLSVHRNEWHHNPRYEERAKLVPKY
jgi:hypothetical protein